MWSCVCAHDPDHPQQRLEHIVPRPQLLILTLRHTVEHQSVESKSGLAPDIVNIKLSRIINSCLLIWTSHYIRLSLMIAGECLSRRFIYVLIYSSGTAGNPKVSVLIGVTRILRLVLATLPRSIRQIISFLSSLYLMLLHLKYMDALLRMAAKLIIPCRYPKSLVASPETFW